MPKFTKFFLLFIITQGMLGGQEGRSYDLSLTRLSPRVIVISGGSQDNNVTAIRTTQGIVVVDTLESPEIGRDVRVLIEKEFKGIPFVYVINTHPDWDHVLGNPAYPEAMIVAHKNSTMAMVEFKAPKTEDTEGQGPESQIFREENRTKRKSAEPSDVAKRREEGKPPSIQEPPPLSSSPPPPAQQQPSSPPQESSPESNMPPPPPRLYPRVNIKSSDYEHTIPDITFTDQMHISCCDANLKLLYYGPSHTYSDILILVPEEKLLFVGDLFFRKWLPTVSSVIRPDVERGKAVIEEVLADPAQIDNVISGHGEIIPRKEFEIQVNYLFSLWEGVSNAVAEGRDYAFIQKEFAIEKKYPDLLHLNIKDSHGYTVHERNLQKMWKHLNAKETEDAEGGRATAYH